MKGLNSTSSIKSLLIMAAVFVLGLVWAPQAQAQTLDSGSGLAGVVSKSSMTLLNNANWISEQEAVQVLMDARDQLAVQAGGVTTKAEKAGLSVRYDYYWLLVKTIKDGSTVHNAVVHTYDQLSAMCAEADNLVTSEEVLQDVVALLSN